MPAMKRTAFIPATEVLADVSHALPDSDTLTRREVSASVLIRTMRDSQTAITLESTVVGYDADGDLHEFPYEQTVNAEPDAIRALAEAFKLAVSKGESLGVFALANAV